MGRLIGRRCMGRFWGVRDMCEVRKKRTTRLSADITEGRWLENAWTRVWKHVTVQKLYEEGQPRDRRRHELDAAEAGEPWAQIGYASRKMIPTKPNSIGYVYFAQDVVRLADTPDCDRSHIPLYIECNATNTAPKTFALTGRRDLACFLLLSCRRLTVSPSPHPP